MNNKEQLDIVESLLSGIDEGIDKQVKDGKLILRVRGTKIKDDEYSPGMYMVDGHLRSVKSIKKDGDYFIVACDGEESPIRARLIKKL